MSAGAARRIVLVRREFCGHAVRRSAAVELGKTRVLEQWRAARNLAS